MPAIAAIRATALALALLTPAAPALAADFILGLGYTDFSGSSPNDNAVLGLEVQSDPLRRFLGADWSAGAAIELHEAGGYWLGAGPAAIWRRSDDWFIEASVMPGYFEPGGSGNRLGSHFEIRSLIGVGRKLNDRLSVSVAFAHKSNAGTSSDNPGANSFLLRTRWHF